MIWHFFEIWLLLFAAFLVGCSLGAALYAGMGNTALANAQGVFADAIGDRIDALKTRFGLGPEWREGHRPKVDRPLRQRRERRPRPAPETYAEAYRSEDRDPGAPDDHAWEDDAPLEGEGWPEEAHRETPYPEEALLEEADYNRDRVPAEIERSLAIRSPASEPADTELPAMRPAGLSGPRNGVPDHLQRIRGIGRANEELLNRFGIYHFGQIAAWTPAEVRWIAVHMRFPETIENDDWIGQAIVLASGGDTGYVKSAERRRARRAALNHDPDGTD